MVGLVVLDDIQIRIDAQGRYCLNDLHKAAIAAGKATKTQEPSEFLSNKSVQAFVSVLDAEVHCDKNHIAQNLGKPGNPGLGSQSVKVVKGGKNPGTYATKLVAMRYAAWIDPVFEVRVFKAFEKSGESSPDWKLLRHASSAGYKALSDMVKMLRDESGKETKFYHYANEAKLVNWALTGKFEAIDRESLSTVELDLLAFLQTKNMILIGRGLGNDQRKPMLKQYAMDWKLSKLMLQE